MKQPKSLKNQIRTIDTSTIKGLKSAERLKREGWEIVNIGFWSITFKLKK